MLQAKTNNGEFTTLASLPKTEIAKKRKQPFFCPTCHEQVIVRAGPQTIPHFAHKSKSKCPLSEGGESVYHEKGKFLLYRWLASQGLDVELEHYLPSIQQRPDILLTVSNKRIAIEYQCARIPIQTVHKRIKGYCREGITPIWIMSAKLFRRKRHNTIKIDSFLQQFIHHFSTETIPVLYFLCPQTKQFIRFQHIIYNRMNQALGRIVVTPYDFLTFPELFTYHTYSRQNLYHDWKREKRFLRLHRKRQLYGRDLDWHNWLYEKRTHKEYMPSVIHLPVYGQHLMKIPLWDWQSRICLDIIHQRKIGGVLSDGECKQLLMLDMIKSSHYPMLNTHADPIKEYLNLLVKEGTLLRVNGQYRKVKQLSFYSTLEDAIRGDRLLMDRLSENVSI